MSTTPMQKVVEPVVREWLQSKSAKIDAILNLVAAQVAPIVADQVKEYFAQLMEKQSPTLELTTHRTVLFVVHQFLESCLLDVHSITESEIKEQLVLVKKVLEVPCNG